MCVGSTAQVGPAAAAAAIIEQLVLGIEGEQ